MKPLISALIFPETEPAVHDIGKLLFFFNSLSYYLPIESENEGSSNQSLLNDVCTGYAPAPLHEDLSRFNRLLREMENSRQDDLARLFSSAKSPIATGQIRDIDESSAGNVFSALQEDNGHKADVLYKERLWQARLILKLAETLDRREIEVRQGLARIASREQKVLATLDGQDETEPENSEQLPDLDKLTSQRRTNYPDDLSQSTSAMLAPIRVKAWAELFLADTSSSRPFTIVTANPDSASILLDGYENIVQKVPQKLFSLSIPRFPDHYPEGAAIEKYISGRDTLRRIVKESLEYFADFLSEAVEKPGGGVIQQKHVAAWEETIKIEFPGPAEDYQKLDFYCLPGISTEILFQKIFHLEPVNDVKVLEYTASILAILHD